MRQDVLASADALASSISGVVRVVVHGIYFDTNKADLKQESESDLIEIIKMLKTDANMKLYMVDHTKIWGVPLFPLFLFIIHYSFVRGEGLYGKSIY